MKEKPASKLTIIKEIITPITQNSANRIIGGDTGTSGKTISVIKTKTKL
jgi:hypothetical protein